MTYLAPVAPPVPVPSRDPAPAPAILAVADADAGVKGASRDPIYALERMVRIVATFGRDE